MYGPTETTMWMSRIDRDRSDLRRPTSCPSGGRSRILQIYVLDAHRQPVPIGVPGELYIGGRRAWPAAT